jgi:hypothetical protein
LLCACSFLGFVVAAFSVCPFLFLFELVVLAGSFLVFLEDALEVVVVFPGEYVLVFLDDIDVLDGFGLFLLGLLEVLPDGFALLVHLSLVLLPALLLLLALLLQLLDLLGVQLQLFPHLIRDIERVQTQQPTDPTYTKIPKNCVI